MNNTALLSRAECSALKGIAILGIFMHNYLHWLSPMVKENEYQFHQNNVDNMMMSIYSMAADLPLQLFSFFGHYGVPVFLFLSGYGLVMKYENRPADTAGQKKESVTAFLKKHFMKLFPMMMLGFTVFAMIDWITPMRHHWTWSDIMALLTMTINILPNPDKIIWPGPYWFFGLMMQLYLLYRIAVYRRDNKMLWALIVISWVIQALCYNNPEGEALNRIRYNCIGGILPFSLGVMTARTPWHNMPRRAHYAMLFVIAIVSTVAFSLSFHTWLWVPALIVIANVAFIKLLPNAGLRLFEWLGTLSAAIFVCHPITRKIFIPISRSGDIMDGIVMYFVTTLMLAMLFKLAIDKLKQA